MTETRVHTASRIMNGQYSRRTEAKQAIAAPNKFNKIYARLCCETFLKRLSKNASNRMLTPIAPIQSVAVKVYVSLASALIYRSGISPLVAV